MTESDVTLRCPECNSRREPEASACPECGLLFVDQPGRGRRRTDHKRASDALLKECPACRGTNEENALRCRYCGEIIEERYRVARKKRIRSQINYASWVAYLLGVVTLFLYKPAGVVAISAGLVLSIAYYAIRVEEPAEESSDREDEPAAAGLLERIKRQLTPEEVVFRHPRYPALRTALMGTPLLLAAIGWMFNYSFVQTPANDALSSVARLAKIDIDAYYDNWFTRDEIVLEFDQETTATSADLRDSIVAIARGMTGQQYERVIVRWAGDQYEIEGRLFARIGKAGKDELPILLGELPEKIRPAPNIPSSRITIPIPGS